MLTIPGHTAWVGYIAVGDVDAHIEKIVEAGGKLRTAFPWSKKPVGSWHASLYPSKPFECFHLNFMAASTLMFSPRRRVHTVNARVLTYAVHSRIRLLVGYLRLRES